MKKLFFVALMIVASLTASADSMSCQDTGTFSFKPFIGVSFANLVGFTDGSSTRTGAVGGVEAQYMLSDRLAVSAGAAYSQQGASYDNPYMTDTRATAKLDLINISVLVNFYVCPGLAIKAGVQPGFVVNKNIAVYDKTTGEISDYNGIADKSNYNNFDLAIPLGLSYEWQQVVLDARYNWGLLDFNKNNSVAQANNNKKITHGVWQITVGYRF